MDIWDVDPVALRVLAMVGVSESLTRAAARLGVTQQAVSARIARLEGRLGVRLVERDRRGARLTESGELVVGWSERLLAEADALVGAFGSLAGGVDRAFTVAASLTVAEYLLPGWLAGLPDRGGIRLLAANSASVVERVRTGEALLGFIETPDLPADLDARRIGIDALVVVVSPQHPWARRRRPLDPAELARTPLVLREAGSGTRRALEHALETASPPLRLAPPAFELPTTSAIRTTVAQPGSPPAVLSRLAIRDDLALGRLVVVPVDGLDLSRPITALRLGDARLGDAAARLLRLASV